MSADDDSCFQAFRGRIIITLVPVLQLLNFHTNTRIFLSLLLFVSFCSAPQALPVPTTEPSASPLHPLQSVGRSFQCHVHFSGPLQ